jgi:hypothetical protein
MNRTDQLIEMLICNCSDGVKDLVSGNYILWCRRMVENVQLLGELKNRIQSDMATRDQTIEDLKNQLREVGVEIVDMDPQEVMEKLKEAPEHE